MTLHEKTAWALAVLQSSRTTAAAPSALSATLLRDLRLLRGAAGGGPQPSAASLTWGEARGEAVEDSEGKKCRPPEAEATLAVLHTTNNKKPHNNSHRVLFSSLKQAAFPPPLGQCLRTPQCKMKDSTWSIDDGCFLGEFRRGFGRSWQTVCCFDTQKSNIQNPNEIPVLYDRGSPIQLQILLLSHPSQISPKYLTLVNFQISDGSVQIKPARVIIWLNTYD